VSQPEDQNLKLHLRENFNAIIKRNTSRIATGTHLTMQNWDVLLTENAYK